MARLPRRCGGLAKSRSAAFCRNATWSHPRLGPRGRRLYQVDARLVDINPKHAQMRRPLASKFRLVGPIPYYPQQAAWPGHPSSSHPMRLPSIPLRALAPRPAVLCLSVARQAGREFRAATASFREHRMPTDAQPGFASSVDAFLFACFASDSVLMTRPAFSIRAHRSCVHVRPFFFLSGTANVTRRWSPRLSAGHGPNGCPGAASIFEMAQWALQREPWPRPESSVEIVPAFAVARRPWHHPPSQEPTQYPSQQSVTKSHPKSGDARDARTQREGPRPNQHSLDPCCRKPFAASCKLRASTQTGGAPGCQLGERFASGVGGTLFESDR